MGLVDTLPISRVRPALFLAPWLGTLRDESVNCNPGTITGGLWKESRIDGFQLGYIDIPACPELEFGDVTVFVSFGGGLISQTTAEWLMFATDDSLRYYLFDGAITVYDGAVFSTLATNLIGSRSITMSATAAGAQARFSADGAFIGTGVNPVSINTASGWRVGGVAGGLVRSAWSSFIVFPGVLTADEDAALHDWSQALISPRRQWPAQGLDYAGPTFTGEPTYVDNIQSARVSLADETSGRLSNTGLSIVSGTWRVVEDATGRWVSCIADGVLRRKLDGADTYTTARFVETGGVVLTKASSYIELAATAGDTISALVLTAP